MKPLSSRYVRIFSADSSIDSSAVSTVISGFERLLVRIADAGEVLDDRRRAPSCRGPSCRAPRDVDRALDVDLDEAASAFARTSSRIVAVGRDRGRDRDDAVAREQVRDEADAADVRVAVLLREAEALREVLAHLVAVEDLDTPAPGSSPRTVRQRALAGARQAGEPEDRARRLRRGRGDRRCLHAAVVLAKHLGHFRPGEFARQGAALAQDLADTRARQLDSRRCVVRAGTGRCQRLARTAEERRLELERRDAEFLGREPVEDLLRVVRAIVVADAGMVASDDQMRDAVVLADQRMEDRFAGPA